MEKTYLEWSMLPDEAEAARDLVVGAGKPRSSQWPTARRKHLEIQPMCQCCGGTKNLNVHHIEPFHINPERELDPTNLITLCEDGVGGTNCHLLVGHGGNWKHVNPNVKESSQYLYEMIEKCNTGSQPSNPLNQIPL